MRNLITDVPGVLVGHADDARLASGATVVLFERPAVAAAATPGGAPALRDAHLLTVAAGDNVIRVLPPLIIGREEADEAARIVEQVAQTWFS